MNKYELTLVLTQKAGESTAKAKKQAMELTSTVGAKLLDYHITRGKYDFCVIVEADSYEKIAAMALMAKGSGTVNDLITLESVDINEIRKIAKKVQFTAPHK